MTILNKIAFDFDKFKTTPAGWPLYTSIPPKLLSSVGVEYIDYKHIKALRGLQTGEMALPPVAPEVINIQSF